MKGHLVSESLSAYLDGEAGAAEARRVSAHLAACAACRGRLEATRRVTAGLRQLAAVAPPPALAAQVRRRLAAGSARGAGSTAPAGGPAGLAARWRSWWLWWSDLPPLPAAFTRPLGVGLAMLVALLLVEHGSGPGAGGMRSRWPDLLGGAGPRAAAGSRPGAAPEFLVSAAFGDAPVGLPQTTSQVAGRVFVLSDGVWVQRGLDASDARGPRARVRARSPEGQALLAKLSDLDVLLADGSPVVLRYQLETLELSNGS
jgi:negative regulator of sigma E activity